MNYAGTSRVREFYELFRILARRSIVSEVTTDQIFMTLQGQNWPRGDIHDMLYRFNVEKKIYECRPDVWRLT